MRFAYQALGCLSIALLFGAAPIKEGTTLTLATGGGEYEREGCGHTALVRHKEAHVGIRHGFQDSQVVMAVEAGITAESEIAGTVDRLPNESRAEFARRERVGAEIDRKQQIHGTGLVRIGYQWKYFGYEIGPHWSTDGEPPVPLPSAVFRVTPFEEVYAYASMLDTAQLQGRAGGGLGIGFQAKGFLFDVGYRTVATEDGIRLKAEIPLGKRLTLGASSDVLGGGSLYSQWNAYGQLSYRFGNVPKDGQPKEPQPVPPESTPME